MKRNVVCGMAVVMVAGFVVRSGIVAQQQPNPRQQPGAPITIYAPDQHDLYDGHFVISANRVHMVGSLNDPPGWNHMDNDAKTVKPVSGTADIDVDEIKNTAKFEARLKIPEGDLVLAIDRFNEFAPCQNGGIVAALHEHGTDSGCGDEMHFMITQGIRDRTLKVNYPLPNKKGPVVHFFAMEVTWK